MATTGTDSRNQDMRVKVKELEVDGDTLAIGLTALADLGGSLTGTVTGTMANVAAIALSTSNTYSDSAVNTAVNTAIAALNLQLKELQTKVNAALSRLRDAGILST